jgi:hypothetical protein
MALVLSITLGILGAVAVVAFHSVMADALGGLLAIAALVVVTRSVIRLAGEAGTPRDASVSSSSGSSPAATSPLRRGSRSRSLHRAPPPGP